MNDQGIAWMIGGGTRTESPEDRRMRQHRIALAESAGPRPDVWLRLRQRVADGFAGRTVRPETAPAIAADCCAA